MKVFDWNSLEDYNEVVVIGVSRVRLDLGETVYVKPASMISYLDRELLQEPYKSMYHEVKGKCGKFIGAKRIPCERLYTADVNKNNNIKWIVIGIERPNGKVYAIRDGLVELPNEEQAVEYERELSLSRMVSKLPELEGIFD